MAPEGPGNITILDLKLKDSMIVGEVDRFDPTEKAIEPLWVSWAATGSIESLNQDDFGYLPGGGGVVYVRAPEGYVRYRYPVKVGKLKQQNVHSVRSTQPNDNAKIFWEDHVHQVGLMLVLVLPEGYILSKANDANPVPKGFKEFKNRMAIYWRLRGDQDNQTRVWWRMRRETDVDIQSHCDSLKEEADRLREPDLDVGTIITDKPPEVMPREEPSKQIEMREGAPLDVPHKVASPQTSTNQLLKAITNWTFFTGIIFGLIGLVLVLVGSTDETSFRLFGQSFRSANVGIAAIFIGVVMIVLNVRRVIRLVEKSS